MLAAIYRNIAKAWLAETEMNKYKYYLSCTHPVLKKLNISILFLRINQYLM